MNNIVITESMRKRIECALIRGESYDTIISTHNVTSSVIDDVIHKMNKDDYLRYVLGR